MEDYTQTPKHGNNYAKHDPRSLAQLADRSTNSIHDEVFATHNPQALPFHVLGPFVWTQTVSQSDSVWRGHVTRSRAGKIGSPTKTRWATPAENTTRAPTSNAGRNEPVACTMNPVTVGAKAPPR